MTKIKRIDYTQTIPGVLAGAIINPTYGTPSYAWRTRLGLPKKILREARETEEAFRKRVESAMESIRKQIEKIAKAPTSLEMTGMWIDKINSKSRGVKHQYKHKIVEK